MITIILCNYVNVQSQNTKLIQPYPIFKSCIDAKNQSDCFDQTVIDHIFPTTFKEDVLSTLIEGNSTDKSTTFSISFIINENGRPINKSIEVSVKNLIIYEPKIYEAILNLPKILPAKNEYGYPFLRIYQLHVDFEVNSEGQLVLSEYYQESEIFSNNPNLKAPIYPGCSESMTNKELKKCFSKKMTQLIIKDYNYSKAIKGFKKRGTFYTYVMFKVNKEGVLGSFKSFGPNKKFEKEAVKSLNKAEKLVPGYEGERAVNVTFGIPLKSKIQ